MEFFQQTRKTMQVFTMMWRYLKLSDQDGAHYGALKKRFTQELIRHLRLQVSCLRSEIPHEGPAIYVCNHISYLDIPLIMNQIPDASFVSKQEVANWPVIGLAAKRIETVFVKRENKSSREGVRTALKQALLGERKKIALFPASTTTIRKTEKWRKGAFEIAQECQVPIIPVRLQYAPLRKAAYIDQDQFLTHLFRLFGQEQLQVQIEFAEPVFVSDPIADCARIKEWCEENMNAISSAGAGSTLELAKA